MRPKDLPPFHGKLTGSIGRIEAPRDIVPDPDRVTAGRPGREGGISEDLLDAYRAVARRSGPVEVPRPPAPILPTWALWAIVAAFLGGLFVLRGALDAIVR